MTGHPLARGLGIAMIVLGGMASVAPAVAASDADLLKEYVGDWRGEGTMKGSSSESIRCRMSLVAGNQDKVIYNGRCTMAGTTMAIQGTVAYLESSNQFVAAMTSNAQFSGQAVGRKRGNSIVFAMHDRQKDQQGRDMDVDATMTFGGGKITTDFKMVYLDNGDTISARVPFSR